MPLVFWATQTMAASNLLGVGDTKITSYISPTSAASTIQYAYRHHLIWCNCRIIPCLRGPYTSQPGCTVATEKWAADMNASYCSTLASFASMYRKWAHLPFAALVSYLSDLWHLQSAAWPHMSSDYETILREYDVQMVLLKSRCR